MQYTIDVKQSGLYDVVVCGAGTAGCMAAIASSRSGAKTLLIERSFSVGGMLTIGNGGITKFTEHCKDVDRYKKEVLDILASSPKSVQVVGGIPLEFVNRMIKKGKALGTHGEAGSYVFTDASEAQWTLMQMLEEAGVEVLYDTRVCMVIKDNDRIEGVVVNNKEGFLQIDAKYVIDATGDADVAEFAGVPCHKGASKADVEEGGAREVGQMMHVGTMYKVKGVDYNKMLDFLEANPDRFFQHQFGVMSLENIRQSYIDGDMFVFRILVDTPEGERVPVQIYNLPAKDEVIVLGPYNGVGNIDCLNSRHLSKAQYQLYESTHAMNECLKKIPGFGDITNVYIPDVGVRESRHIEGEYMLTGLDVISGRDFEDSIGCGGHPVDVHPIPPEVENMDMNHWRFHIPYSIMVPKKVSNLLVTGRCVSASRIAFGGIRPTAQCMVMGEAAGTAAAILSAQNVSKAKDIDIQKLRSVLKQNGVVL